jgi:phosphoribosylformimino-5-aminoimidazole carboxamide ribotide isomerase
MKIFPAIDIFSGKAVRLLKGDYDKMTVYSDNPLEIVRDFESAGAEYIHLVDLEGAKTGETPNIDTVRKITAESRLFCEIGGGIRSMETAEKYFDAGVNRVILGTAAVTDRAFLVSALKQYGDKIAVGVDIKDGYVAIKGWTEASSLKYDAFLCEMRELGVKNVIVTDISKDGAMKGTNRALYGELSKKLDMDITASGGVTSIDDIIALKEIGMYAAIIGKAYYTGAINLKQAIEVAK